MRPSGPASRHEALPGRRTRRANGCANIPLYFSEQESGAGKIPDRKRKRNEENHRPQRKRSSPDGQTKRLVHGLTGQGTATDLPSAARLLRPTRPEHPIYRKGRSPGRPLRTPQLKIDRTRGRPTTFRQPRFGRATDTRTGPSGTKASPRNSAASSVRRTPSGLRNSAGLPPATGERPNNRTTPSRPNRRHKTIEDLFRTSNDSGIRHNPIPLRDATPPDSAAAPIQPGHRKPDATALTQPPASRFGGTVRRLRCGENKGVPFRHTP